MLRRDVFLSFKCTLRNLKWLKLNTVNAKNDFMDQFNRTKKYVAKILFFLQHF